MSVVLMASVFASDLPPAPKLVLLALADHADDDGGRVYPSVARVAGKASLSERQTQRILGDLRHAGLIEIVKRATRHDPTHYRIRGDRLTPLGALRGDIHDVSGVTPTSPESPVKQSPINPLASDKPTREPDELFEVIVEACGWSLGSLTRDARGRANGAAKQLREVGADPPLMRGFADLWAEKYPGAPLTPQAFTNNWPDYMAGKLWPEIRRRR